MQKKLYQDQARYGAYVKKRAARSPVLSNCLHAGVFGGVVCAFSQSLLIGYRTFFGMKETSASTLVTVTLIFLAALATGAGLFPRIARIAGAGTLVPVTGFANAVASPAVDTKSEGWILGVGAKIFGVAGPVILYGALSGVLYGAIEYLLALLR